MQFFLFSGGLPCYTVDGCKKSNRLPRRCIRPGPKGEIGLTTSIQKEKLSLLITQKLREALGVEPKAASNDQYYKACALVLVDLLEEKHRRFSADGQSEGKKQVYYLSFEFLLGRSLKNNLFNLGLTESFRQALEGMGVQLEGLYDCEPDAGLGNGGLGRLAACYLDALACRERHATGYCILYEFGIFRQKIIDGWQTELPDQWLPGGGVWLLPRPEASVEVRFGGQIEESWQDGYHTIRHTGYSAVTAVPYDLYVSGYDSRGVSLLRLWKAKKQAFDMQSFQRGDYLAALGQSYVDEAISKILYPNDNHTEGKLLRLRQQYFLVAASCADIFHRHLTTYGSMEHFAEKNAIHINDTHPVLAIPEFMRLLLDECGYEWDRAWDIVQRTFAYTNHTVLPEALETWDEEMLRTLLPRIYQIIVEINNRFCGQMYRQYHLDTPTLDRMSILYRHQVRMANLAVIACHSVNGVSGLHSEIIRRRLFGDFARLAPQKFCSVTNGIASRRWLCQANPGLDRLLRETIGEGYLHDFSQLERFAAYEDDPAVLKALAAVKRENKERLARHVKQLTGQILNPDSVFDVQVKRLHEYKRQHLNALSILTDYLWLTENPQADFQPRTYLFGAKAAPGYYMAKQIIQLLCMLAEEIDRSPAMKGRLQVVYLEDYNVTLSELLMPAAEISEQISLAGTEASGTGNMKLMLGGALTVGTLDGANVEITQAVGRENIFLFGMTEDEVRARRREGYRPEDCAAADPRLTAALQRLEEGVGGHQFHDIAQNLLHQDPYMVLADFDSYRRVKEEAWQTYGDRQLWNRKSLRNIAASGIFCADRAVEDYARLIWQL